MKQDITLYNQALDRAKYGFWGDAKALLLEAIALNAHEPEYHSLLGVAYLGLEQTPLAQDQFRIAYNLNPQDSLLQNYLPLLLDGDDPPNAAVSVNPSPLMPNAGAEVSSEDEGQGSRIP